MSMEAKGLCAACVHKFILNARELVVKMRDKMIDDGDYLAAEVWEDFNIAEERAKEILAHHNKIIIMKNGQCPECVQ